MNEGIIQIREVKSLESKLLSDPANLVDIDRIPLSEIKAREFLAKKFVECYHKAGKGFFGTYKTYFNYLRVAIAYTDKYSPIIVPQ